jgi:hypothetical protein
MVAVPTQNETIIILHTSGKFELKASLLERGEIRSNFWLSLSPTTDSLTGTD